MNYLVNIPTNPTVPTLPYIRGNDGLGAFYGVGEGTIAIHYATDAVTLSGGNVVALQNKGGAGAVFDAKVVGAAIPLSNKKLAMGASNYAATANMIDTNGVRLMFVLEPTDFSSGITKIFGSAGYEIRFNSNASGWLLQAWSNLTGTGTAQSLYGARRPNVQELQIVEIELNNGSFTTVINGVQIGSGTIDIVGPSYFTPVDRIGAGSGGSPSTAGFIGLLGDVLGVTLGAGSAEAITAARAYLRGRFSL